MSAAIRRTPRLPLALLAPLAGALLVGCATAPAASTIETTAKRREMVAVGDQVVLLEPTVARTLREELAMPAERAWALLPLAYEALGLPLTTLDSDRRLIGAGGVRAQGRLGGAWLSRYVDCGTASTGLANADSYAQALSIANEHISASGAIYVAAQVGGDVYVFADTGDPQDGADVSILLTGRTLADIGLTNFV